MGFALATAIEGNLHGLANGLLAYGDFPIKVLQQSSWKLIG